MTEQASDKFPSSN